MGKVHPNLVTSAMWSTCDDGVLKVWVYLILQSAHGVVRESNYSIAARNGKSVEEIRRILGVLAAPDPSSRNPRHEGRRIIIHEGNDSRISLVNADAYSGENNGQKIDYEPFELWWKLYGKLTGKLVGKKQTRDAFSRLDVRAREGLVRNTEDWWRRRAAAAHKVFVPCPPDPVRFLRHRRWEDQWAGVGNEVRRSLTKNEVAILDAERLANGHKPNWLEYQEAVFDGSAPVGSFGRRPENDGG